MRGGRRSQVGCWTHAWRRHRGHRQRPCAAATILHDYLLMDVRFPGDLTRALSRLSTRASRLLKSSVLHELRSLYDAGLFFSSKYTQPHISSGRSHVRCFRQVIIVLVRSSNNSVRWGKGNPMRPCSMSPFWIPVLTQVIDRKTHSAVLLVRDDLNETRPSLSSFPSLRPPFPSTAIPTSPTPGFDYAPHPRRGSTFTEDDIVKPDIHVINSQIAETYGSSESDVEEIEEEEDEESEDDAGLRYSFFFY